MLVVRATKKLRDRIKTIPAHTTEISTTTLGDWYATALFWRPQVALWVNEATLLPVLVPLAPAASLAERFCDRLAAVLSAHGASGRFIDSEVAEMAQVRVAKTANRSVVGIMNEFSFLAEAYLDPPGPADLLGLSMRLAETPCGPLYQRHISPDRELAALLANHPDHNHNRHPRSLPWPARPRHRTAFPAWVGVPLSAVSHSRRSPEGSAPKRRVSERR